MTKKYSLNKTDGLAILKVIGWSVGATVVSVLITVLADLDVPQQYAFLVPIANTALYSAQRFLSNK